MTVDQWELAALANALRGLYEELNRQKTEKAQAPRSERKQAPSPGPREPGNGNAISMEDELLRDCTDPDVPGGLMGMVADAALYTSDPHKISTPYGGKLCEFIRTHAYEIVENFPAADDLHQLMQDQVNYLTKHLDQRKTTVHDMQRKHSLDLSEAWGTAAELAPLATAHTGKKVSRDLIRQWGNRDKLPTIKVGDDGHPRYNLQEIINHVSLSAPM